MSKQRLVTNSEEERVESVFKRYLSSCDELWIGAPFFSDSDLLSFILNKSISLRVLVGLQYPTSPNLLRALLKKQKTKIECKFYDFRFHSKIYLFFKYKKPIAAIVGSSNFTEGGMSTNIETNILLSDSKELSELKYHFIEIWDDAGLLSPSDIDKYEKKYDKFKKLAKELNKHTSSYHHKYVKPRLKSSRIKVIKEASQYFEFWKAVDQVERIVRPLSKKVWPNVNTYLTVDHFWHYIKSEDKGRSIKKYKLNPSNRETVIPKLFNDFITWDKQQEQKGYFTTKKLSSREQTLKKLLNPKRIFNLTRKEAATVYSNLHSGWMRTQRFSGDKLFANDNPLEKIRKALNYLLWSDDDIDKRISALIKHPDYKLNHFGSSNIQELLGWVHDELPIRNKKADAAVEMLGFMFK